VTKLQERIKGRLGDLLPLKYGKSLPAAVRDSAGSVPVYGSSGVVGSHSAALTNGPVIIVGRKGNVGAVHYSAVPCWPIDTAYFAEQPIGHDPRYYRYLLDSLGLARLDKSTAIPGLSRDDYNAVEVVIHPPEQQAEIVAEIEKQFSRLDEAVANLQRVKANLKRYKASVLKAAVEGRLVETEASIAQREGRSYETGEQLLQRILEERRSKWTSKGKYKEPLSHDDQGLPEIPKGWAWCSLDAVPAETLIGLDRGRDQQREEAIGVRYVKMNNVSMDGDVQTDDLVYVDASSDEVVRYELVNGDLLFNTRNSLELVGKVGIVRAVPARTVFNNNLMRIRTPDGVSPFFLGYQMCASDFRQRMEKVKKATTSVAAVYQKDLLPLAIALPPKSEQIRIVAEIDRHLSIISEVQAEVDANLQRAQALRQATLSSGFSCG
jgi:type I restriction enzyme S subunit